jgi:hypothetical protein
MLAVASGEPGGAETKKDYVWRSVDSGTTWASIAAAGQRYWMALAASDDGTKITAFEYNAQGWTSADSGATWTKAAVTGAGSHVF